MHISLYFLDQELDYLGEYSRVTEEAIVKYLHELEESFKAQTAGMNRAAESDFYEWSGDIWTAAKETFPQVLRSSLFVACYSMLEVELHLLCRSLQAEMKLKLSSADLKGQGISRSRVYMKKVAGVAFPDESTTWNAIASLTDIRNVVVHMRGLLLDNDVSRSVRKFAEAHPDLATVHDDLQLVLSDKFCPFAIKTLRQFASELVQAIDKPGQT